MAVRTGTRDPRTIITPDAFAVSPDLLGVPLAPPRRRLIAIVIDLVIIGIITAVTSSFALVLGVVAAIFFMRAGFKRTPVKGSVFGRAMRLSVGCLGIFIGGMTMLVWSMVGFGGWGDDAPDVVTASGRSLGETGATPGNIIGLVAGSIALSTADDAEEAEEAMRVMAEAGAEAGLPRAAVRDQLLDDVPEDASWADEAPDLVEAVLAEAFPDAEAGATPATAATPELDEEIAVLGTEAVLLEYADFLGAGGDEARGEALRRRLVDIVAADTLDALDGRIARLEDTSQELRDDLQDTVNRLREATSGGLFARLRDFIDELGFGFGWASLYMTVMLSWWKGQTPGKRMMGIRVLRLDGEPINWWTAFERGGGYAAGFATGLLGFAQVYWDANRQAIHDHIVGTVVVREGAEKVTDWEEAL